VARLGSDRIGLTHHFKSLERPIDAAGAIHVLFELAETFRVWLGGIDDGFGFLQRTARPSGGFGGLVGGAAFLPFGQFARTGSFLALLQTGLLAFLRRCLLQRLQPALDRNRLAQREALAVSILGELGSHHFGVSERTHDGRDVSLAIQLGSAQPALTAGQLIAAAGDGPHHDRFEHIDGGDVGRKLGNVAHVFPMPLADYDLRNRNFGHRLRLGSRSVTF
jgi:hypothetical protein